MSTLSRKTPLKRFTPLAAKTTLRRATLLRATATATGGHRKQDTRFSTLTRRARIATVSTKRRAENRERAAMAARCWEGERPMCARPGCPRWADDLHEILTRARGGSITDEANTVPLCRQCNEEATLEPAWVYECGLQRHSWDKSPAQGGEAA